MNINWWSYKNFKLESKTQIWNIYPRILYLLFKGRN